MRKVARLVAESGYERVIVMGRQAREYTGAAFTEKFGGPKPELFEEVMFEKTAFNSQYHPQMQLEGWAGPELAEAAARKADELLVRLTGGSELDEGRGCVAYVTTRIKQYSWGKGMTDLERVIALRRLEYQEGKVLAWDKTPQCVLEFLATHCNVSSEEAWIACGWNAWWNEKGKELGSPCACYPISVRGREGGKEG